MMKVQLDWGNNSLALYGSEGVLTPRNELKADRGICSKFRKISTEFIRLQDIRNFRVTLMVDLHIMQKCMKNNLFAKSVVYQTKRSSVLLGE